MLNSLECLEDLMDWNSLVNPEPMSEVRVKERVCPFSVTGPALTLSAAQEMESWLIRSGLSPHANLPVSRIGLYTDFA